MVKGEREWEEGEEGRRGGGGGGGGGGEVRGGGGGREGREGRFLKVKNAQRPCVYIMICIHKNTMSHSPIHSSVKV